MIESNTGFDLKELDKLNRDLLRLAGTTYPEEAKRFLQEQANAARVRLRKNTQAVTTKRTGNLLKGVNKGRAHTYAGSWQVRVYNKAPHAHLIEHGHVMANSKGEPILNASGQERWVNGRFPAAKTTNELKALWPGEVAAFVDEILREVERG